MIDYNQIESRLSALEKLPSLNPENSIPKALERSGFTRRDFMKWAGAMTAFLALPASLPLWWQKLQNLQIDFL